jgi:hypothetical protein
MALLALRACVGLAGHDHPANDLSKLQEPVLESAAAIRGRVMYLDVMNYVLDANGEPQPEPDLEAWGHWFERASRDRTRIVAQDKDERGGVDVLVSTVFLGLDHNFGASGPPVLWETMILGGPHDGYQRRYASRAAALEGHQVACALAKT